MRSALPTPLLSAQAQDFRLRQASITAASAFENTLPILKKNTAFTICIPAAFIRMIAAKSTGLGGRGKS